MEPEPIILTEEQEEEFKRIAEEMKQSTEKPNANT
jgi:hypothetical protein